jgi:hypothetical protein
MALTQTTVPKPTDVIVFTGGARAPRLNGAASFMFVGIGFMIGFNAF